MRKSSFYYSAAVALALSVSYFSYSMNPAQAAANSTTAPAPSSAPSPTASGPDSHQQALLNLINDDRAQGGLPPLKFSGVESQGTPDCVGSYGHSLHMGQTGDMAHDQFPEDICIPNTASGENIGYSSGGEDDAVKSIHQNMMNEGPGGGHYDNLMSSSFTTVGIGIYYVDGVAWMTEDFVQ